MYFEISKILDDKFENNWFLDSGSLLGIIRDGKFLESDKGIDISVIIDDYHNPIIEKCVNEIESLGFVISRYQWNRITYKYCLAPLKRTNFEYAIDLHLFKKVGDTYICPQIKIDKLSKLSIINLMRGLRKGNMPNEKKNKFYTNIFNYLYRDVFKYFHQPMNMNILSNGKNSNVYKWYIPCGMFKGVVKDDYSKLNVLIDCDDYLTFRYGNWHIPVSDWVTLRDDGGIEKFNIEQINQLFQ